MREASARAAEGPGSAPGERFLPWHCGASEPAATTAQHDPWVPAIRTPLPVAYGSVVGLVPRRNRPPAVALSPPHPPPRAQAGHPAS
jgi:hypothetical protein